MDISAETRRLALSLALASSVEADRWSSWTQAHTDLVRSQGLGPWMYAALRPYSDSDAVGKIRHIFLDDYRSSAYVSLLREGAVRRVLSGLSALGIGVAALKGAYLGQAVYRDAAQRPMSDVDLMVREDQFEAARAVLESLDYVGPKETLVRRDLNLEPALVFYRPGPWPDCVDLHMAIWGMDYYRFPSSIVWDDVTEGTLYGEKVLFLSQELNFIHLAVHNLNHSGLLRDWLDLVLLCRRPGFDWDRMVFLGRSLKVLRPLHWAFVELEYRWGTPPPPGVKAALKEYVPRRLEDLVIRHPMRYLWRLGSRIALMDGWRKRLQFLRLAILPPADYRRAVSGSEGWLPYISARIGLFAHHWRSR